ncbi:MAG: 2-phospho-L-lactate transferase [Ardenticatenales bacterium]|nr:2-phospho-L-lactate transferase [Ardenticatenales bacterium]
MDDTAWHHVVALAGGVGGAKLAEGLQQRLGPRLTVVGNVADDEEIWGLHISPDLDSVMYWLAGVNDEARGWGLADETWHTFETLERIGSAPWFRLGDRDLATHLTRTTLLHEGKPLTEVTARLARGWGVQARLLPVTDDRLRTIVHTEIGPLAFQDYFVRHRWEPAIQAIRFEGEGSAQVTAVVQDALRSAEAIILCPSNPFVSIEPLLRAAPLRELLRASTVPIVAVSPIVGGEAIKGPAAKMFRELGEEPSALAVARRYTDFLDGFLLDERDAHEAAAIEALGLHVAMTDTLMEGAAGRRRVADAVLTLAAALRL